MKQKKVNNTLKTNNLSIGYKLKTSILTVASTINMEFYKGELVALVGRNGVGKSTLLKSLSGLQKPLSGEVYLGDEEIGQISSLELAQKISLVLTGQPISKNLTVKELVALGRQPYTNWLGTFSQKDHLAVEEALKMTNINSLQDRRCYELSDGQLQQVFIARAISQNTPLIILDEPTSHLDLYHKAQVLHLLKELTRKTGKTIIFASHEINLAIQLCDRMILMEKNKVKWGSPRELINRGAFSNLFPKDLIIFDKNSGSFKIKEA